MRFDTNNLVEHTTLQPPTRGCGIELETKVHEVFTITEKALTGLKKLY